MINERLVGSTKILFLVKLKFFQLMNQLTKKLYDYQIPIGSLGQYLENPLMILRSPYPLLRINNDRFEKNKKLRCGFTWKSKGAPKSQQKSLNLELLRDLFEISGIEYFSIQYSADPYEIDNLNKKLKNKIKIPNNLDIFNDIYGLLKFIDSCDFIFQQVILMHIYLRLSENPHIYYFQKGMVKFGIGKMTLMKKFMVSLY